MSYEIYYDKRFIKVKGGIIPIVQAGSSHCWENIDGQKVREKYWTLINYPHDVTAVFTEEELISLYQRPDYDKEEHKSIQGYHENLGKWLIAGIKSAMTIEEHSKLSNTLQLEYFCGDKWITANFDTEEEFWDAYRVINKLDVTRVSLSFTKRDIRKSPLGVKRL